MQKTRNFRNVKSERVKSIDIVRGIAVVQMIFWHMFDFLAKADFYKDFPYFIRAIDAPVNFSVVVLFLSMSGASLYLSISRRLKRGMDKNDVFKHIVRRYGLLVVLSFIFTTLVLDFCTFVRWEEAVQGIGLTAIVASTIVITLYHKTGNHMRLPLFLLSATIILLLIQPLRVNEAWTLTQNHMYCNTNMKISQLPASILLNLSVRGFFSITGLLPLMLSGVLLGISLKSGILKKKMGSFMSLGILLIALSIMVHPYYPIDFYGRSYSLLLLEIGIAVSLLSLIEYIVNNKNNVLTEKILNFFVPLGMFSLVTYFGHFILVYKSLQLLALHGNIHLINSMPPTTSATLSLLLVIFFREVNVKWIKMKQKSKK